jgi:hypothetical protein
MNVKSGVHDVNDVISLKMLEIIDPAETMDNTPGRLLSGYTSCV